MTRVLKHRLVFVSLLLLSLQFASAQIASGLYTLRFDSSSVPLWDFTGPYEMVQDVRGPRGFEGDESGTPLAFTIPYLAHENSGQLHGSGLLILSLGNDVVAANYSANGSVSSAFKSGSWVTRVNFSIRLTGQDVIVGAFRRFSASITYKLEVTPDGQVSGTSQGSISVSGVGSGKIIPTSLVPPSLPNGADGSWQVQLNLLALKKLGGTATVIINNFSAADGSTGPATGRIMPAKISGSYNARTSLAKVQLSGTGEGRGLSLTLTFDPDSLASQLSGKILGQTIRLQ